MGKVQTINPTLDGIVLKLRKNPVKIYSSSPKPGVRSYWYLGNVNVASENGKLVIKNEVNMGHGCSRMENVLTREYFDNGRITVTKISPALTGADAEKIVTRTKNKWYTSKKTEYKTANGEIISRSAYNLSRFRKNLVKLFRSIKNNLFYLK